MRHAVLESFAGFDDFLVYLAVALVMLWLFTAVYVRVTPYREFDLIRGRLEARKNHYMKAGLLESQFAALEEPRDAVVVSVIETPDAIADRILRDLKIDPIRTTGSSR